MNYFEKENNYIKYSNIKSKLEINGKIENPLITIAIPTYKRNDIIIKAILSSLNQKNTEISYEIIIVDNDKENLDLKKELLKLNRKEIYYYKNLENIGMFGNWNRCIELARGKYITILNDDDWLEENFLLETKKYYKKDKLISCLTKIQDERKEKIENKSKKFLKELLKGFYFIKKTRNIDIIDYFYRNMSYGSLGLIFEVKKLKELGGYNEKYYPSSDYVLHAKYVKKYGGIRINKYLVNYRIGKNESLKKEVLKNFVVQGNLFRKYLIEKNIISEQIDILDFFEERAKKREKYWGYIEKYNKNIIFKYNMKVYLKEVMREIFK